MKGMEAVIWIVISLALAVLVLVVYFFVIPKIIDAISSTDAYSACESGTTVQGMCIHNSAVCPSVDGFTLGSALGGCPSPRIKSVFGDSAKEYTQCCVVTRCGSVLDGNTPRKEACFNPELCGELGIDTVDQSKCVGFSENSQAKDGLCCVQG